MKAAGGNANACATADLKGYRRSEALGSRAAGLEAPMLDYRSVFEQSPSRLLVVSPEPSRYSILSASNAYLDATLTTREIICHNLFDVFPDNPDDSASNGTANLHASLVRALAGRSTDRMPLQRYDIKDRSGRFIERHWAPINAAVVKGDGTVVALVHRVEDVTAFVKEGEHLRDDAAHLRHEIFERGRELALANAQLRYSIEQRRKIIAIVSHDLRGSLMAIQASTHALARSIAQLQGCKCRQPISLDASSRASRR